MYFIMMLQCVVLSAHHTIKILHVDLLYCGSLWLGFLPFYLGGGLKVVCFLKHLILHRTFNEFPQQDK